MKDMNKNAIISVICSVISLFIFWWLGGIGIGLGIRALQEIKSKNEKGKVFAIIGMIIGIISISLYIFLQIKKVG